MWRSLWRVAAVLLLACGCEDGDVIVNPPPAAPPNVVVQPQVVNVYPTTYVETIIREEDTTPDVVTVYEWSGSEFPAIICEEEGVVSKKVSDLVAATALGDTDLLLISQGGVSKKITVANCDDFPLPTNHIAKLITGYGDGAGGGDTGHDATVGPGKCRSAADDANMVLAAAITKRSDAAWAVGTGNGGMDAGAVAANTLYAIWLIARSDTGVVDALFSLSFTAPTMPASYDRKRLIGAVFTDSSTDIVPFSQCGDEFVYLGDFASGIPKPVNDATITNVTWKPYTLTSIPPRCKARISAKLSNAAEGATLASIFLRTPTVSSWPASLAPWAGVQTAGLFDMIGGMGDILVDSNKQIEGACNESAGTATLEIWTFGFTMLTRRDPL